MTSQLLKSTVFRLTVPAVIIIILGAFMTLSKIRTDVRIETGTSLATLVKTVQQGVKAWFSENRADALLWANSSQVREYSALLAALPATKQSLLSSPTQTELRNLLRPVMLSKGYKGFFIIGPGNINLSSSRDENIGVQSLLLEQPGLLNKLWSGETGLSLPQFTDVPLSNQNGEPVSDAATMFVGAPIKDDSGKVLSILLFRINPAEDFTAIFQQARLGQSGESYAFDKAGRLISESRFDDHLRTIGLIKGNQRGILNIQVRNPGVNLVLGEQTVTPRSKQPLTLMASSAITGVAATNIDGYRDYRGVKVIGAWLWDDELNFGITSEIDFDEVNQFQFDTRITFLTFVGLAIAILIGLAILLEVSRRQLDSAKNDAEIASRTKSAFLSAMNHELRTPMNILLGYGELLANNADESLSVQQQEFVDHILSGGRKLHILIDNILTFTEITDDHIQISRTAISAYELVSESMAKLNEDAKSQGITLINESRGENQPFISVDPKWASDILSNFISNAIQYNHEGGSVNISTTVLDNDILRILVSDTGQGISEQYYSEVFQPFHRFKMANSAISGVGIGLAISKCLAELMGGSVGFDSEEGVGSRFWVDLPVYQKD